jgi:hypothetical protein
MPARFKRAVEASGRGNQWHTRVKISVEKRAPCVRSVCYWVDLKGRVEVGTKDVGVQAPVVSVHGWVWVRVSMRACVCV